MDYHDKFKGRTFREVPKENNGERKPRTVEVIEDRLYEVITKVVDGRGKDLNLQIPRKQLIDPAKWTPLFEE